MNFTLLSHLLYFYGTFLIVCGIVSVLFIGMKAKTALASGSISGLLVLSAGYCAATGVLIAPWIGIALSMLLFCVFFWRATKTLFALFELIPVKSPDLKGKGIAFLMISLMGVISFVVFMLQIVMMMQV